MNLKKIMIGDHCIVTSSKRFHLSERVEVGIPFYRSKEIIQKFNGEVVSECDYIPIEEYVNIKKQFGAPRVGDLLLTTRGTYGVPYIYKEKDCFYFADGNITWFKDFDEQLNSKYLYYWFQSYEGYQKVDAIAKGTAQKAVPITTLKQLELYAPIIDLQNKIVDILSTYDDLIENNQKQIKLLEEAAQRLYKEWFIDLRFPGHENVETVDGVPEGWNIRQFNEVFSYVRGKSYKSSELSESEGVLLVNLKNINAFGGYKRNAEKRYIGTYKADQRLDAGDIVMGVTDMTQERRLVGHVAIVPDLGENMTFSMDLIKLIPKSVTRSYLYSAMRFGRYSEQISPFANGVNVLHLKPEAIMNMIMVVPSKEVLERYENIFESYRKKIELLEKLSNYLTEARDRLLPKLMSGEIEV